ncbi:MAG: terminase family protein [Pseudomonadota bacterium]
MDFLKTLSASQLIDLANDWRLWGRLDQLAPELSAKPWRTWLFMGGRGAGKTRAGAQWITGMVAGLAGYGPCETGRIALIGETFADVRDVMVGGDSGLLACAPSQDRPNWVASRRTLEWSNGATAMAFSSEDPEALRGPQFEIAWGDELGKWVRAAETFDMLQFALRLGSAPRQLITTTPRPVPTLKALLSAADTVTTRARTQDNAANLAPEFLAYVEERYGGSALGRQELAGELIEEVVGALWTRAMVAAAQGEAPTLGRIIVAVDPPAASHAKADECGIIVAGLADDGVAWVLDDLSVQGARPEQWAAIVADAACEYCADRVVAEANQGGDMVDAVLRSVEPNLPVKLVHATRGKHVRAEPVATLYARRKVRHARPMPTLEDQMCAFDGSRSGGSPDRLDALVWALTELVLQRVGAPKIRTL